MRLAPTLVSIAMLLAPCRSQEGPAAPLSSSMRDPAPTTQTNAGHLHTASWPGENGDNFAQSVNATMGREPGGQLGGGGSQPIPEPSTLLLVGGGLVGIALSNRWRRRRSTT